MEREPGKGKKLAPTHQIVGVYDSTQYVRQMTAIYTEQARLRWHNARLLAKAKPGDTAETLTRHGHTTPLRVTELQIVAAQYLLSRYPHPAKFIADEVKDAYRNTGYIDGRQYVLKEVRGERTIANTIAHYQSRGFRDVRAVPIDEAAG